MAILNSKLENRLSVVGGATVGVTISNPLVTGIGNLLALLPVNEITYPIQAGYLNLTSSNWGVVGVSVVACVIIAFVLVKIGSRIFGGHKKNGK